MNQEACLSLPSCQFFNGACADFIQVPILNTANPIPANNAVISPQICTWYNNSIANAYFIYDETRGYCVNVNKTNPSLYIAQCSSIGVNSKICLEKTNEYCQFNEKCTKVSLIDINAQTACNNTYNWYACIKQTQNCKFQAGKCVPLLSTDIVHAKLSVFFLAGVLHTAEHLSKTYVALPLRPQQTVKLSYFEQYLHAEIF